MIVGRVGGDRLAEVVGQQGVVQDAGVDLAVVVEERDVVVVVGEQRLARHLEDDAGRIAVDRVERIGDIRHLPRVHVHAFVVQVRDVDVAAVAVYAAAEIKDAVELFRRNGVAVGVDGGDAPVAGGAHQRVLQRVAGDAGGAVERAVVGGAELRAPGVHVVEVVGFGGGEAGGGRVRGRALRRFGGDEGAALLPPHAGGVEGVDAAGAVHVVQHVISVGGGAGDGGAGVLAVSGVVGVAGVDRAALVHVAGKDVKGEGEVAAGGAVAGIVRIGSIRPLAVERFAGSHRSDRIRELEQQLVGQERRRQRPGGGGGGGVVGEGAG